MSSGREAPDDAAPTARGAGAGRTPWRLHPFEVAVLATARERALFGPEDALLAAISGGADSTAMLAALAALRDLGHLRSLAACHVDHRLREGSADDGVFCAELAARFAVRCERVAVQVRPGAGVEESARAVRYAALRAAAGRAGSTRIATGHHRGDQAETVLHRLLRGSGARGLAGIPPRRGLLVRPLIDRTRPEIRAYLAAKGLTWREDPSNASARHLRNRLRSEVLPLLEALVPGLERRLCRTADLLREDDLALEALAAGAAPGETTSTALGPLAALPPAVQSRVVRRLWRAAAGHRDLAAAQVTTVLRCCQDGGGPVALPAGLHARAEGGLLSIGLPLPVPASPATPLRVDRPGAYALPGLGTLEVGWEEGAAPTAPLLIRGRQPGDRFRVERGAGDRKLKAWLIDRKVPRAVRARLVVLAAGSRVLALPELGVRAVEGSGLSLRWTPFPEGAGQPPG